MIRKLLKSSVMRRILYFLIMAGFLYMILKKLNSHHLVSSLKKIHFAYLVPSIFVYLSSFYLRAFKWKVILKNLKNINSASLLRYILIGCSGNALLPARMGEILRAYVAGKEESVSSISLFSTILIERFLEVLSLMILFSISVTWLSMTLMYKTAMIVLIACFFVSIFLVVTCYMGDRMIRLANKLIPGEKPRRRLNEYFQKFIDGIKILRNPPNLFWVILIGLGVYLVEGLAYWGIAKGFSIEVSLIQVFFLLSFIFIGLIIPSTIGNIGPLQYFCILGLSFFKIDENASFVYAVFLNLLMYIPAVIGLIYLYRFGVSIRDLRAKIKIGALPNKKFQSQGESP